MSKDKPTASILLVVFVFALMFAQHYTGLWYNKEEMEDSYALWPAFIYGSQILGLGYYLYRRTK